MKLQMRASVSAIAAAVMLASCASKGVVQPSEYQQLADNANKQVVCRYEAVTGSRIQAQVCFTRAQLQEQRDRALQMMREMQQSAAMTRTLPDRPPSMPPSEPGGRP